MKNYLILFLSVLLIPVFANPAHGQEKDSVTVSVEALQNLKAEYAELEKTVSLQDSLIEELEYQIKLYEQRSRQDSLLINLTEEKLEVKDERIKIRDERIDRLEEQRTWEQIKKYIWTTGALVIGFFVGNAS